jgi:uncharacterized phage protein (TIGR01671 family)
MRTIKFRVWDKVPEKMIYLNDIHDSLMFFRDGNASYYSLKNGSGGDEYELMQSTGLLDKNGKEIYEGDLVYHKGKNPKEHTFEVVWKEYKWHFNEGKTGGHPFRQFINHPENFEVIGNIYEKL